MKQQNLWQRYLPWFLLGLALASFVLIPLKRVLRPRVLKTFYFDNRKKNWKIKRLSVVGDFSDWKEYYYLNDPDSDGIWTTTVPLKIGWHSYRFLINGKNWIRDWENPDYGGAYSNSLIYVDTIAIPKFHRVNPSNGSWLYAPVDTLCFVFSRGIKTWLKKHAVVIELDSLRQKFLQRDSSLLVPLPKLIDGEHDWSIRLTKKKGTQVLRKQGLFYLNLTNQRPKANAGATQIVFLGQNAILSAGGSFDPDFEPIKKFYWECKAGKAPLKIDHPNEPMTTVRISQPGRYRFSLTVWDSMGMKDSDQTMVVVLPEKKPQVVFEVADSLLRRPVRKIALVGEFNQWDATKNPMHYDSLTAEWRTALSLSSGKWEYKFVVNDSLWIPDPGNPIKIADGWNGFNSLKIIPHDSIFDGHFVETQQNTKQLVISYQADFPLMKQYLWIEDIQNPAKGVKKRGNRLYFEKSWPNGTYYFYLVLKQGTKYSRPHILFINHYQKTEWHDLAQTPAWADTAIIYELFLHRFTKQGDFKSLMAKLDYLKNLGVNTIWMLPIYQSPTEHGYAPTSLFNTAKAYGTLSEYRSLIAQAHAKGMRVIFDFVANHLSDQHRFVKAAYQNPASPLRSWFYWKADGTWGYHNDWDTLVNLNYHSPWVRHYMLQVAGFWQSVGVDGFRCDVAWAVPHDFWKNFRRSVKAFKFNTLLLDEVLPRQPQFHQNEFDMSYDTDFYGNVLDVLHRRKPLSAIVLGIEKSRLNYPAGAQSLRYLENHDLPRFITQFGPQLTRLMAVVLFTIPGTPLMYYGQEFAAREIRPYFYALNKTKWFDFYQKLIKFRKRTRALTLGCLKTVQLDDAKRIWWYRRQWKNETIDVLINLSDEKRQFNNVPDGKIVQFEGSKFKQMGNHTIKIEKHSFIIIQRDEGK